MGQILIDGQAILVRVAAFHDIVDLRHAILRAGLPREMAVFPGDDMPTNWHFGAFLNDRNVGCASFHQSQWQRQHAWQLRGMATDPALQGKGIGRELLAFAEDTLLRESPLRLMWCNARTPALGFYQKQGWQSVGDEFIIETAGPHFKMFKRL
jgi:GNAT superfamily N-acetyltransferase